MLANWHKRDMLLVEISFVMVGSHYPIVNYFLITAHLVVFFSYVTCKWSNAFISPFQAIIRELIK